LYSCFRQENAQGSVWLLLFNLDSELTRYMQRILALMAKAKRLKKPLCDALQHAIRANIKVLSLCLLSLSVPHQYY